VFGLADEVCHDELRARTGIGDDEDLGGTGLRVDPRATADDALRRGDVDVARPGDDLHGVEAERRDAVGQRADGARTAHRVHLGDSEQAGRAEDRRVDGSAELTLRRRHERDGTDTGHLRGHHVHHDARRIDGLAPGHVEPDPVDRLPSLLDDGARAQGCTCGRRNLRPCGQAHAIDRGFEGCTHLGIELCHRLVDLALLDAEGPRCDTVESHGLVEDRVLSPRHDVVDQLLRGDLGYRHVGERPGHQVDEF
jgi:hypothetical protein